VGELVSLEVNQGCRLAHAVLELTHDLSIDWTAEIQEEHHMWIFTLVKLIYKVFFVVLRPFFINQLQNIAKIFVGLKRNGI